jgi:putative mRNA 3-end processing factor
MLSELLSITPHGLYCPRGDFYVDPKHRVPRAVITHAHGDHARGGHQQYIGHPVTLELVRHRTGPVRNAVPLAYGERRVINGVDVSLHPAGHVPGSAQVRLEHGGFIAVVSGDYKREDDGLSEPFEVQRCHHFVTESTFGAPMYRWEPQAEILRKIVEWHEGNQDIGRISVLSAYALGKSQRLIANLASSISPIVTHRDIHGTNSALRRAGVAVPETVKLNSQWLAAADRSALIIAPGTALREGWLARLAPVAVAAVSGWMAIPSSRRRWGGSFGFAMSDHADWEALHRTVRETGAESVWVEHGYAKEFARSLRESGINAAAIAAKIESGQQDLFEEAG